jgi:hypothetical protein
MHYDVANAEVERDAIVLVLIHEADTHGCVSERNAVPGNSDDVFIVACATLRGIVGGVLQSNTDGTEVANTEADCCFDLVRQFFFAFPQEVNS